MKKTNIGIISTWPGCVCAEMEVFERFKLACKELDIDCSIISSDGHLLDENQKLTQEVVDAKKFDFVIAFHYEDAKLLDAFYYHPLWNPPEFPLMSLHYPKLAGHYMQYDDYLIYGEGTMLNHLKSILLNSPRNLENASLLVASFPESAIREPNKNPKHIFYCGMNWEILMNDKKEGRHSGLFKKFDDAGVMKIYGPDKVPGWNNAQPWKGYRSYQFQIPFDGTSILDEINKCGVVLCISSDVHRRAGAASSRIYEATVGGAVIISDDNPFVKKHFKDAALFVDFNKDNVDDTYNQIMEKYNWIINNPQEAQKLVEKAQQIFREKFSFNKTITNIIENHPIRQKAVAEMLFAKDETQKISALYILRAPKIGIEQEEALIKAIENIKNQTYKNIDLCIACDEKLTEEVKKIADGQTDIKITIQSEKFYNDKNSRLLNQGQIFFRFMHSSDADYFMIMSEGETWFSDHVTTLKRTLEDNLSSDIAYSGEITEYQNGNKHSNKFDKINCHEIFNCHGFLGQGQILMKNNVKNYLPEFVFESIDGLEIYLMMLESKVKLNKELVFSKRNSFRYKVPEVINKELFNKSYQINFIQDLYRFSYFKIVSENPFQKLEGTDFLKYISKLCKLQIGLKLKMYKLLRKTTKKPERIKRLDADICKLKSDYSIFKQVR